MSGPQGSDPTQPWPGQQPEPGKDQPSSDASANQPWQPPTSGAEHTDHRGAGLAAAAAYDPQQQQYPQYQQPSAAGVPAAAAVPADRAVRPAAQRVQPAGVSASQYGQPGQSATASSMGSSRASTASSRVNTASSRASTASTRSTPRRAPRRARSAHWPSSAA